MIYFKAFSLLNNDSMRQLEGWLAPLHLLHFSDLQATIHLVYSVQSHQHSSNRTSGFLLLLSFPFVLDSDMISIRHANYVTAETEDDCLIVA